MKPIAWMLMPLLVVTLGLSWSLSSDAQSPKARLASDMSGKWDMSKSPRPHIVYLTIRKDDHRYPSFWTGRNQTGDLQITSREDLLSGDLVTTSTGGFTLQITNTARKLGMEDTIPGGAWMWTLREKPVTFQFERFTNWTYHDPKNQGDPPLRMTADYVLSIVTPTGRTRINGSATFNFSTTVHAFNFRTDFTLEGSKLGLEGWQAGPLNFRIHTATPPSIQRPTVDLDDIPMRLP